MEDIISPKSKKIVLMRRGEKRPPQSIEAIA